MSAAAAGSCCLQTFELYATESNFYMFGSDNDKASWRVLKIDRLEPTELKIDEDAGTYTHNECRYLLKTIDEENKSIGGLKFVTNCYGIIGFIKFLGPYYMLLITERRQIGKLFGHNVYEVTKSDMIELTNSKRQFNQLHLRDENRYKKLLRMLDLRKDFFFSYSYYITRSLQKNVSDPQEGWALYETMFVWNEFLTRGIRTHLKSTLWTVALVYGYFKQDKLLISQKDIMFTLIARRSRHYAGTRYLKRGVNEKGRVANDVETEQIVYEDISRPTELSSIVQNRGSIPLYWSQETSKLNLKPDIILHEKERNYESTRLHFEHLRRRYGNPIIILNLIKKREKKPRESILRCEFIKAIKIINRDLPEDKRLRFLHWDLHENSHSKATNVLAVLLKVALEALNLTDVFYCQVPPTPRSDVALGWPAHLKDGGSTCLGDDNSNSDNTDYTDVLGDISQEDNSGSSDTSANGTTEEKIENSENFDPKPPKFQKGVLRTNCIDCLDRTNVAQYAYGLAALGHQLHALGLMESQETNLDTPLADYLMQFYEKMGDTLAIQYGGSAAHNKIFSARRGHTKFIIQSQEFFRTLQRHYSNAYMDAYKQAAINLFLGYFQPQEGRPALWELDSDQNLGEHSHDLVNENSSRLHKRAQSDGNILRVRDASISGHGHTCGQNGRLDSALSGVNNDLVSPSGTPDSGQEISESEISHFRYTPSMPRLQHVATVGLDYCDNSGDSNFLDMDLLSSSGMSGDEDFGERSTTVSTPVVDRSTENIMADTNPGTAETQAAEIQDKEYPERFAHWVEVGETFWY